MISRLALCLLILLAAAMPGRADDLGRPAGAVVLTVTGAISVTNAPGAAEFDLAMLEALRGARITTETPWYAGKRTFEGPLISALLDSLEAEGRAIRVTAVNDYSAEIPMSDILKYPVILATRIDGDTLSIREKGPSFVIYPFDQKPELYDELHFGRSVWQVKAIKVY
jgi:hypothetical protein